MSRPLHTPPPLPLRQRVAGGDFAAPLAVGCGVVLAAAAARLAEAKGFSIPCRWFLWTGIPCPGCGASRCLAACGRFDFVAALRWHPLVALMAGGFLMWAVVAFVHKTCSPLAHVAVPWRPEFSKWLVAALIANWLYLCWALPR